MIKFKIGLFLKKMMLFTIAINLIVLTQYGNEKKWEWKQKRVKTMRLTEKIRIDGILDEKSWKMEGVSDFTQSDPDDGKTPTEKTEVWFTYDNDAIYIAARLYDSEPDKIMGLLSRRDEFVDSDYFLLYLDPYYDRRTGFKFAVSPAGSIVDWALHNDGWEDQTWDGVWEAKTKIDTSGWTCEIKIPFDQLRFKKNEKDYVWGINFKRIIKRKNEVVSYSWIPKTESGKVSRFAKLEGIKNINPKKLFEVIPYTLGKAEFTPKEQNNPFKTGKHYMSDFGVDFKYGINNGLTLDLSINPDFGQVEVDPARINLSAGENFYSEKRPFFIEGANIFTFGLGGVSSNFRFGWHSPRFFYSRRIGRAPSGQVDTDGYIQYPLVSKIIGAAKVSGKIGRGWELGFLTAMTSKEYASLDLNGEKSEIEVEPFSNYSVLRIKREFNEGAQGLGFILTSVVRDLKTDLLSESLNKNAFSFGLDGWLFIDKNKDWVMSGWLGTTQVSGTKDKITDLQNSYPHYQQRPDATHLGVDESATSLSGYSGRVVINKQNGNFLFNAAFGLTSPGFDTGDIGFQTNADFINWHILVGYQSFTKWGVIKKWSLLAVTQKSYDFGWNLIGNQQLRFTADLTFTNYWSVTGHLSFNPEHLDNDRSRGGPMIKLQGFTWYEWNINSDSRKKLEFSFGGYQYRSNWGNNADVLNAGIKWKPGSKLNISINSQYKDIKKNSQWIKNLEDSVKIDTYGKRYIFAELDQKTISLSIRFNWLFSPKLSLQAYVQPYISIGSYHHIKELAFPKSYDFNIYGQGNSNISETDTGYHILPGDGGESFMIDNPDFNYKSLRGTIVLRWEYMSGSTLFLVWTQNRTDWTNPGSFDFSRNFSDMINAPGDNIFMLKFSYRFKI